MCLNRWFLVWMLLPILGQPLVVLHAETVFCHSPSLSEGPAVLDGLFDEHDYVFLARVDAVLRPGVLAKPDANQTTELFVFQPALKGAVPGALSFATAGQCSADFSEGAVYLIFSNDLTEAPVAADVRAVMAYESGPSIEWIARWADEKHRSQPLLQNLSDLQWQHRVLLIDSPESVPDTLAELRDRHDEVDDRDLLWWVTSGEDLFTNYSQRMAPALKQRLLAGDGGEQLSVVLIGKDGSTKLDLRYFDLDRIFARIDSMPMRTREMLE